MSLTSNILQLALAELDYNSEMIEAILSKKVMKIEPKKRVTQKEENIFIPINYKKL